MCWARIALWPLPGTRSTEGYNASSRGGPVPGQASGASAPGNRAKVGWNSPASQSPLHGFAMLSPLCTRGAAECLRSHTALPRWAIEPGPVVSTWQGLHAGPYRCWLASTGAQEQTAHTAFSEFWVQRHAGSGHRTASALGDRTRNKAKKTSRMGGIFCCVLCQDCKAAPAG